MTLHITTLMVALLLGFLMLTLELGVSLQRIRSRPELRSWSLGCWALLLGFGGLAIRPLIPVWLSVIAGNGLICLGLVLYCHATHQFLTQSKLPRWMVVALVLTLVATVATLGWPLHQRTAVLSLCYVVLMWPSVWLIVRRGWQAETSLRTVAVTMALAMLALLLRAGHAWTHPQDYTDILQASLGQGLTFLVAFISLLGAGFGFVLAVFERVTSQLEELATHDGLTNCLNRSTTDAMLVHELQRGRRLGAPLAFVLLDLDHFKLVNDRHGHRTGDAALRMFASTVREKLRESDVLGRTGGEEFGLILPGTDLPGAQRLVERIRLAVEAMPVRDEEGQPVRVTLSAGVAVALSDDDVSPEHLYGRADKALYAAKRGGRNRIELYGTEGVSAFAAFGPTSARIALDSRPVELSDAAASARSKRGARPAQ